MQVINTKLINASNIKTNMICPGVNISLKVGYNMPCIMSSIEKPETNGEAKGKPNVCQLSLMPFDADAGLWPLDKKKM